jgi:purine-nucleoside phosphorylase
MSTLHDRLTALTKQVRSRTKVKPRVAILLGTGLGGLAERLKVDVRIPYHELTGMPVSTAESHKGCLLYTSPSPRDH